MCFLDCRHDFATSKMQLWTNYLLCLQHVGLLAETSQTRIVWKFLLYRCLTTFCRSPELPKNNQNTSQKGVSGYPKSDRHQEHIALKKHQKYNTQKVRFRMQKDLILGLPFRSRGLVFRGRSLPKITKIKKSSKLVSGPPFFSLPLHSNNPLIPKRHKMTKNNDSDLPKSPKIMSLTSPNH